MQWQVPAHASQSRVLWEAVEEGYVEAQMRGLHGLRTVMSSCLFTARVNPQSIEQGVTQTTIKRGSCSQVCCAQHPTRLMVRYGLNFVHTQPLASLDLPCPAGAAEHEPAPRLVRSLPGTGA